MIFYFDANLIINIIYSKKIQEKQQIIKHN